MQFVLARGHSTRMSWWLIVLAAAFVMSAYYWLLVVTEGTYLGTRVVTWLYNIAAWRYDRAKKLHIVDELRCIGIPLADALATRAQPRVLDVATGTGRVPLALLRTDGFWGSIYALDRSQEMLAEGHRAAADELARARALRGDARALPFENAAFDAVTCLEAIEFMPKAERAIDEMVRVLKPGAVLLLSNRVGADAWWFPGRMAGRGRLERHLRRIGLESVRMERWQVHYDLVWAQRPAQTTSSSIAPT